MLIPRLAPRTTTSSTRSTPLSGDEDSLVLGDENKQHDISSRNNKAALILLPPSLPARSSLSNQASREEEESSSSSTRRVSFTLQAAPLSPRRTILASSNCSWTGRTAALEAPSSPSASNHQESLHQYLLQDPSSALTPPATGPRPLVVSARRIPQVRRQRSSKRRRRRRDATCAEEEDAAAHCLWRDAGTFPRAPESSSEEEDEERLPCRPNAQGYWEYCYGRGKGGSTSIAVNKNSLPSTTTVAAQTPTMSSSWSASRKPPTKGCLWHRKPKSTDPSIRNNGVHATKKNPFLTPSATPEEDEETATPDQQAFTSA